MKKIGALALVFFGFVLFAGCTRSSKEPAKTLHIPVPAKIKGLDPILADDLYSGDEVGKVYESLFQYSYLKRPYTLEPQLADGMPSLSTDKKTYTFKMKKGVLFQDDPCFKDGHGRELIAEDFIYSFKRLADPKNVSPGWWTLDDKVVGLNEWRDEASRTGSADYSKSIEGLKALDRYTLQMTLKKPNFQILYGLAMSFTAAVPHEAVEKYGKEFINHPVGTGPFKLTEFNPSARLIWDRNPTFRSEVYPSEGAPGDKEAGLLQDAGQPLPRVDRIVTQIFEEQQPKWLNFMAGKLDIASIPKDNFETAIGRDGNLLPELKAKNIRLEKAPQLDAQHTTFNMDDPLIGKNKLLRQAISLAHDSTAEIKLFYNGLGIIAQGPIPPGLNGYDSAFKNPYREFNLQKAKELLAKAGFPDGKGLPVLEVNSMSSSTDRQMSEFFEKEMAAIGIKLKVSTGSWPQFQEAVKNKKGQLWSWDWGADYPDAEDFLMLFYSRNVSPGANDANYRNPEYDKLYEKALDLPDSPERTAIYKQMVQILAEDTPWIYDIHRLIYFVTQPWMKNYKYSDTGHDVAKYYGIDTSLKK